MKYKGILSFLICLVLAGYGHAYSPEYDDNGELTLLRADRNQDGYINFTDIGMLASAWLEEDCGLSNPCECADVFPEGGDGVVDFRDFAVHAELYGLCIDPTNPDCLHVPLTLSETPFLTTFWVVFIPLNVSEGAQGTLGFGSGYRCDWRGHVFLERQSPLGFNTIGRRYGTLIPGGARIGGSLVIPQQGSVGDSPVGIMRLVAEAINGEDYYDFSPWSIFGDCMGHSPGGGGGTSSYGPDTITDTLNDAPMIGGKGSDDYVFGNRGFGTYGGPGAKPLVPSLPGGGGVYNNINIEEGIFEDCTFGANKAPGGAGDDDYVFGNWGFGTYGGPGAKPLLPSLPGASGIPRSCTFYEDGSPVSLDFVFPFQRSSLGASGDSEFLREAWKNELSKLWFEIREAGKTDSTFVGSSVGGMRLALDETATCVFSGICGKTGEAGLDTGWTDSITNICETSDEVDEVEIFFTNALSGYPGGDYGEQLLIPGRNRLNRGQRGAVSKVHRFSGEFTESAVDLHIPGRGPDFVWKRIYRSRTGPNTIQGNNWDFSYNIYLTQYGANLILHNDGRRDVYYNQGNGTWARKGFFRELAQEDDESFTLTFPHKGTWKLHRLDEPNAPGKINAITDRNGNSLTFEYDSSGRLTKIFNTLDTPDNSREIEIAYNVNGFIESVTDWAERQVRYEYYSSTEPNGSACDLKSVTSPAVIGTLTGNDFPDGKTTIYTYSRGFADERLNHNLLTITNPKGQTYLKNTYGTDLNDPDFDHLIQQSWGDSNNVIHFTYIQEEPEPNNNYAVTRTIVNDCNGNVTEHFYNNRNQQVILRRYTGQAVANLPTSIDPNINTPANPLRTDDPRFFESRCQYNDDFLPTRTDYPNGNYITIVYESDLDPNVSILSRGNCREIYHFAGSLESVSDQNEITVYFEYDPNANHGTNFLTRYIDPRGNETLCDYDPNGNRTRTTYKRPTLDPNIVYEWQYNEFGQVAAQVLPDNGSGSRRRDEYVYYAEPDDPNYGYLKYFIVDTNNLALTTTFKYDDVGNLTCLTDPCGHDTQYVVNELNQVIQIISSKVGDGIDARLVRTIRFEENDNIIQIDVGNDVQWDAHSTRTYEYDNLNYLTSIETKVDTTKTLRTEFEYDRNHNLTLVRSGQAVNGSEPNNVIRYLYDERNLLFQTIRGEGDPNQSTTQYDYDGNGNLKKVSRGLGSPPRISSFQYDGFNRLVEVNDPMGNTAEYHYDPAGNVLTKRIEGELHDGPNDANNIRLYELSNEYDTLNRLVRIEISHFDPNTQSPIGDGNVVTQFYYNDNSQLTRVVNDNTYETHYEYDTANRRSALADAKGNTTTYSYDENSNIVAVTEEEKSDLDEPSETFVTTFQYDNLGRLTKITDNNENSTQYAYDSNSNSMRVIDARDNEVLYEYDGLNRLIQAVQDMDGDGANPSDANDIVTSWTWDDNSRLVSRTDDNGNITTYEYDALNRKTRVIYADLTENRFAYNVHHDIVKTIDAAGTVVNCSYDLLNRLTAKTISPGSGVSNDTTFENYRYDGLSRLVEAQDDDSLVECSYDSLSNVISETLNGRTTTAVHDGLGNRLSCTYPGGRVITCTYDELNRKKIVSADGTDVSTYYYIGPGRLRLCDYGNNTQSVYSYDRAKRIIGTTHSIGTTIIDERTYSWDETYNKTQQKDVRIGGPQLTHDYTYDAANRLKYTKVTDGAGGVVRQTNYSLDGVGNRTSVTGSPNPGTYTMDPNTPEPADFQMNQYTTTPFDARQYDKNGNLITINSGEPNQKDITYDYRNRMVEVNDTLTSQIHTYIYDAFGRRIEKVVDANGSPQTTRYIYDGWQVVEERDDNDSTLATYVYGNYTNEVVNMQRDANDYYYHSDDRFNIMAITDGGGLAVERYEYQDYGEPNFFDGSGTPVSSTAIGNPYLFTGRRYDLETGWILSGPQAFKVRAWWDPKDQPHYGDPAAGRFTSR